MLTLTLHAALATAIQTYAQRYHGVSAQRTTTLNAASQLLGYPDHRMARHELQAGDEPILVDTIRGQTYLMRAAQALAHVSRQTGRTEPLASADVAAFAQEMLVSYDLALWQALGMDEAALWAFVDSGHSTVIADVRVWVCCALQRGLAYILGQRYDGQFGLLDDQRFFTTIHRQHWATPDAAAPRTGRTRHGTEFTYRKAQPNIFYRARVDFGISRLALPLLTPAMEMDYDAYIMSMCDSVHAVYAAPPQQATRAWAALCASSPVPHGYTLISVVAGQVVLDAVLIQ